MQIIINGYRVLQEFCTTHEKIYDLSDLVSRSGSLRVVSPHFDDAPLSCGGLLGQASLTGNTTSVVNICTRIPQFDIYSELAKSLHRRWKLTASKAVESRKAENDSALEILRSTQQNAGFYDAIYRRSVAFWLYPSDDRLFGRVHTDDDKTVAALVTYFSTLKQVKLTLFPLSIGNHVDHQVAFLAGMRLHKMGVRVAFWEDYPYADPSTAYAQETGNMHGVEATLARHSPHRFTPYIVKISHEAFALKVQSVRCYTSQLPMLFGDPDNVEDCLVRYSQHINQDGRYYFERLWFPV